MWEKIKITEYYRLDNGRSISGWLYGSSRENGAVFGASMRGSVCLMGWREKNEWYDTMGDNLSGAQKKRRHR